MAKKVMIDCDVGVDDALALVLAFHSSELEVMGVTGVNGNVPLKTVFINIQKVLSLIKPEPKPYIARGAERPLMGESHHARSVHGETGLGEARLELKEGEQWWVLYPGPAEELIARTARQCPKEVTLIALGPLTNLALGLQNDPEGMKSLKEIIVMGGAVRTAGNVTGHAEFNIHSDPIAAKVLFESNIPITLVPLDVTHQVFLTPEVMEKRILPLDNAFSRFVTEATGYDPKAHRFKNRERIFLHDPLAVGAAMDPTLVKKERLHLTIGTETGEGWGKITEGSEGPAIDVCLEVDAERFLDLFISSLKG